MENRYNHHNRRKYNLKVHIVLVTKYRKQILKGSIADDVKQKIYDICKTKGYGIIAMETDKDHIHFLISYDTTDRVCDIVKLIKQQTTHYLWQNIRISWLNAIGSIGYFGQTDTLLVVLEKYLRLPYRSTSKAKVNGYEFTRLLPPPKGSGFPPTKPKGFYL